jgi:uncharacterized protein (TIGR02391 family)
MGMSKLPCFDDTNLQAISDVLGDANSGLTHAEISKLLRQCGITELLPNGTKRSRIFEVLSQRQKHDNCGNNVAAFIIASMKPVRYLGNAQRFEDLRLKLNRVISFTGLTLEDDGMLYPAATAKTISDAEERAGRLRKLLQDRKIHSDVLRFCRAELLQDNYFHAVFEATKSVADKIREKSGLTSDGSELVEQAFGIGKKGYPLIAFNSLQTETEHDEHKGLMNLLKGLFGTFRNTTAHAPRIKWVIDEQDALDMLSLTSLLHRRIDQAVPTGLQTS